MKGWKSGDCDNLDGAPANETYGGGTSPMRLNAPSHLDSNAWTDPSLERHTSNTVNNSSCTFQFDDGKMTSVLDARDFESDRYGVFSARFKMNDFVRDAEIDVHGDSATEGLMWAMLVVPVYVERNLASDDVLTEGNENTSGAFVFYGPHQSFNNGYASVLANSAKALFDIPRFRTTPSSEICRYKLTSLIGNQMSWRPSHRMNGVGHEGYNFIRGRLLLEDSEANDRTGEMVNHHNDPPAEWPNLRQAEWSPGHPESCCRDGGHIHVPNVIGVSCGDDSAFLFRFDDFGIGHVVEKSFFQDASDGCGAKVQSSPGQHLSDAHLPHGRAKGLEPLCNAADPVRILVHGLGELEKPICYIGCSSNWLWFPLPP